MTIPSPPPDNSGGYIITTYTNGTDTHKSRMHVKAFGGDGTYLTPGAGTPTTVQADWTGLFTQVAAFYNNAWQFTLTSLFLNNMDGTFTEQFGWTVPTVIAGSGANPTATDQSRAQEEIFNFKDGHGGRGRLILIATGAQSAVQVPSLVGGSPTGTTAQKIVDYLTNPVKTNMVSRNGHQYQSPARFTVAINKRLRRHYGYA